MGADVDALKASGEEAVVVVYAPWCQFCQAMEEEYEKLAEASGLPVYKFRGDEEREYVEANMNTKCSPRSTSSRAARPPSTSRRTARSPRWPTSPRARSPRKRAAAVWAQLWGMCEAHSLGAERVRNKNGR